MNYFSKLGSAPSPKATRTSRSEIMPLVLALIVTVGLLGGAGWMGIAYLNRLAGVKLSEQLYSRSEASGPGSVSVGDRLLVLDESSDRAPATFHAHKAGGVAAMGQGKYYEAAYAFEAALRAYPNAPETLIYLNNALIGSQQAVELAVTVPISGSNPNNALEMLRGFAQAQQEVNAAGGIKGLPLRLHIADDGDDPEVARALASQFARQDSIKAVIGHWTSDVSLAAAEIYNQQKLPFMTPISTTNELSTAGPYSFRTALTNAAGGQALAEFADDQWKLKKAAIFYAGGVTYSEEIRQQFSQTWVENGGEIVAKFDLGSNTFKAKKSVQQATEMGAEVLLIATNNASLDRSLQVIQANQGRLKLLGDLANLYNPKTLDLEADAEGLVMALSWSFDQRNAADFVDRSQQLWQASVNYATVNSYDALKAVVGALQSSAVAHREEIAARLIHRTFVAPGAGEAVRFRPSGDRQLDPILATVRSTTDSRSGTGYDFVSVSQIESSYR